MIIYFALVIVATLASCATGIDPNYAMQLQTYNEIERARLAASIAKAQAEAARYDAIARLGSASGDREARTMAMLALALGDRSGNAVQEVARPIPPIPESDSDRAYKWAALFVGPVSNVAFGWFGYRLGQTQSNNAANQSIASTNALQNLGTTGFQAVGGTASNGFNALQGTASSGFTAIQGVATSGFQNVTPSITLSGQGAISTGSGGATYTNTITNRNCTTGAATGSGTTTVPPVVSSANC